MIINPVYLKTRMILMVVLIYRIIINKKNNMLHIDPNIIICENANDNIPITTSMATPSLNTQCTDTSIRRIHQPKKILRHRRQNELEIAFSNTLIDNTYHKENNKLNHSQINKSQTICKYLKKESVSMVLRVMIAVFIIPTLCKKLLSHGTRQSIGCNLGKKCEFFHPQMCI